VQTISASIEGSLPEHTERWQAEKRESVVKYGEIIADNLSKAGWSLGWSQPLIPTGEQFGLLTHIATTDGALLCAPMKS